MEACRTLKSACLDISSLQLIEFPIYEEQWRNINSFLNELDVSQNCISYLPEKISQFIPNTTKLNVRGNQLLKLPTTFGFLKYIQILDLSFNKFTEFPREVYRLKHLQELILSNNSLVSIPAICFEELQQLKKMDFTWNKIVEIPWTIGRLSNLQVLKMGNNQLRWIPKELSKVMSLQVLDLSYNYISIVPRNLVRVLEQLKELNLTSNSLTFPPADVVQAGVKPIIDWLKIGIHVCGC